MKLCGRLAHNCSTVGTQLFLNGHTVFWSRADSKTLQSCVVDGKIVSQTELQNMSPSQIDSMTVIKDKTFPDYIKYSTEAGKTPNAVIIIKTK